MQIEVRTISHVQKIISTLLVIVGEKINYKHFAAEISQNLVCQIENDLIVKETEG